MPIKLGKKVFDDFDAAAEYIKNKKKIPIKNARAYVAEVERKQRHGAKQQKKKR